MTFDNGSGPGTAGLALGAGLSTSAVTRPWTRTPWQSVTTRWSSPPRPSRVRRLLCANSQVVTVVADSTRQVGVASVKNLETVVFTPAATSAIAKKTAITINPTTNGTYHTYNDTTVSSGKPHRDVDDHWGIHRGCWSAGDGDAPLTAVNGYDSPFSPISSPAIAAHRVVVHFGGERDRYAGHHLAVRAELARCRAAKHGQQHDSDHLHRPD